MKSSEHWRQACSDTRQTASTWCRCAAAGAGGPKCHAWRRRCAGACNPLLRVQRRLPFLLLVCTLATHKKLATPSHPARPPSPLPPAPQRYVKIAAMLPRKSVRDVALRCRWTLNQQLLKKRKPGEALVPPAGALGGGAKKPLGAAPGLMPQQAPALPPVPMVSESSGGLRRGRCVSGVACCGSCCLQSRPRCRL